MQFALESYLIPFENVLPQNSEIATEGMKENLQKMGRNFVKFVIGLWTKFIGLIRQAIAKIKSRRVVEFDDYIEEEEEYFEETDESPKTTLQRNDKLVKDICNTSSVIASNLTYICTLVYGPDSGDRKIYVVNGMKNDVLSNNLTIFENTLQRIADIPQEEQIISMSVQGQVTQELTKEANKAEEIRSKLNTYYDKMQPGDSWVDNEMIKLMPEVNKKLTEYVNKVSSLVSHLWMFTPVK